VPGRFPQLLKTAVVERAERRHKCHRDDDHLIRQGDLRITISVGRDVRRYCVTCAATILNNADAKIGELRAVLDAGSS
jgi:hypothetical protein